MGHAADLMLPIVSFRAKGILGAWGRGGGGGGGGGCNLSDTRGLNKHLQLNGKGRFQTSKAAGTNSFAYCSVYK